MTSTKTDAGMEKGFSGSKLVLLNGSKLAVIRRDDVAHISWPGRIDLPGGARDPGETPERCGLRETLEEVGLEIAPDRLIWSRQYAGKDLPTWLFAAKITGVEAASLKLGDEGQACWMMEIADYLAAEDAIPHQQDRVREVLDDLRGVTS